MWLPKRAPFWHPFGDQNRSKNRSEIELLKKSLQDRPETAQDPPKMPPGPPRRAPGSPKRPPGPPPDPLRMPQEALPDLLGRPKTFSEASGPITFFGKLDEAELVENMSKKKGRHRSSTVVTHIGRSKTESTFTTVGPRRVAAVVARSALQ